MKVVLQRVSAGGVFISDENYRQEIAKGMVLLLGIKTGDTEHDAKYLAAKCANMRIFEDENGKMNLSAKDILGEALVISQFTLYGDASKGNRPSFIDAARPESAIPLYEYFTACLKSEIGEDRVKTGIFGAMMEVTIINDGPVTILLESKEK